jgi:competence protein ComEA
MLLRRFYMSKVRIVVSGIAFFLFSLGIYAHAAHGVININKATKEELMILPGIGEKISKNIVSYRQANGPFKSVDDLTRVKGITRKKLDKIRQFLVLDGQSTYIPVDSPKSTKAKGSQKPKG